MIAQEPINESEGKPVLTYGKDYVTIRKDNIPEVEEFLDIKIEDAENGWYAFPNDGKSRRTFLGDSLMLDGDVVKIYPVKLFKNEFEVAKK